jgi:hypothetical protein
MTEEENTMIPYNAYEIEKARRDYIQEGDNRERLAAVARAGGINSSLIARPMKKIPGKRCPARRLSTVHWKAALIGLVMVVTGVLSLGILGVRNFALKLSQQSADDALMEFQALRPGNSQAALNAYQCEWPSLLAASGLTGLYYCNMNVEEGRIRLVTITVHYGLIRRQEFFVRGVQVGDLVMKFGKPDRRMRQQGNLCLLSWHEGITAAARCDSWLNYQSQVESITWSEPRALSQA